MILVVGGLGFIGRRVVECLVSRSEVVRVLDIAENVGQTLPDVEVIRGDATDFSTVHQAMRGVEVVINLAALTDVRDSLTHPHRYFKNNFTVHLNVLEASRRIGCVRIVLASSAAVYGDSPPPLREDGAVTPTNPYGVSKQLCEQLSLAYHSCYGVPSIILRYFNVLGEGGRNVLKTFVEDALSNQPLRIKGRWIDERFVPASRDFVYVGDVAEATVKAITLGQDLEILNIGSGRPESVEELARIVLRELGVLRELVYCELSPGETLHSWADITRAQKILNWTPKTSLTTIVKKYVEWFGKKG